MPDSLSATVESPATAREDRLPASFRDPAGYVFRRDNILYRRVTAEGAEAYAALIDSGLYQELTASDTRLLVPHQEVASGDGEITLLPEPIPLISYPYEWCFGQLKDAALAMLEIQRRALERGLWLKDASAYNIQFHEGRPLLIDTLSFEPYREGQPWPAYKQFCQHFLAPLALMSLVDPGLGQLLRIHLDGIPLDLASKLLPAKTKFKPGLLTHIHLHASAQKRHADDADPQQRAQASRPAHNISKTGLLGILDSLRGTVAGLDYQPRGTVWEDYYNHTNYSDEAMERKREIVRRFLDTVTPAPQVAWDLGANTGAFSRLCADRGLQTIAWDIDFAAVEKNWRDCKARKESHLLPLLQDLTNPSPGIGWAGAERDSFVARGRGRVDVVLALALIHHLAITNNVPFTHIARLFADLCAPGTGHLIVEWVPAEDSQAQRLLANRDGDLDSYRHPAFLAAFEAEFHVVDDAAVAGSRRRLYLMRHRNRSHEHTETHFAVSTGDGLTNGQGLGVGTRE